MGKAKFFTTTFTLQSSFLIVATCMFFIYMTSAPSSRSAVLPAATRTQESEQKSVRLNQESSASATEEDFLNSSSTAMDDPKLIQIIKERFLLPPSTLPYNLKEPDRIDYSQSKESTLFDEIFSRKESGFFIECGALDGEFLSGSLFFEKTRHWSGLLVEAGPHTFVPLTQKNRKAYKAQVCGAVFPHPHKVKFKNVGTRGTIVSPADEVNLSAAEKKTLVDTQCLPFYSLLLAVGNPTVDLFILDVEGAETRILKTIPFDKVDIKYLYIEHNNQEEHKTSINEVMTKSGYEFVRYHAFNVIYRKK